MADYQDALRAGILSPTNEDAGELSTNKSVLLRWLSAHILSCTFFYTDIICVLISFQFRGAMNAVLKLIEGKSPDDLPTVVTHSTGNHAQALALAAKITGLKAHIVMSNSAPAVKKAAVKDYGAHLIECGISEQVK